MVLQLDPPLDHLAFPSSVFSSLSLYCETQTTGPGGNGIWNLLAYSILLFGEEFMDRTSHPSVIFFQKGLILGGIFICDRPGVTGVVLAHSPSKIYTIIHNLPLYGLILVS